MKQNYKIAKEIYAYLISIKFTVYILSNAKYDLLLFHRENHNTFIFGTLFSKSIHSTSFDFGCLEKIHNGIHLMCWEQITFANDAVEKIAATLKEGKINLRKEQSIDYLDPAMSPNTLFINPGSIVKDYAEFHSFQITR